MAGALRRHSETKHHFTAEAQLVPPACCLEEAVLTINVTGDALCLEERNDFPGRTE